MRRVLKHLRGACPSPYHPAFLNHPARDARAGMSGCASAAVMIVTRRPQLHAGALWSGGLLLLGAADEGVGACCDVLQLAVAAACCAQHWRESRDICAV